MQRLAQHLMIGDYSGYWLYAFSPGYLSGNEGSPQAVIYNRAGFEVPLVGRELFTRAVARLSDSKLIFRLRIMQPASLFRMDNLKFKEIDQIYYDLNYSYLTLMPELQRTYAETRPKDSKSERFGQEKDLALTNCLICSFRPQLAGPRDSQSEFRQLDARIQENMSERARIKLEQRRAAIEKTRDERTLKLFTIQQFRRLYLAGAQRFRARVSSEDGLENCEGFVYLHFAFLRIKYYERFDQRTLNVYFDDIIEIYPQNYSLGEEIEEMVVLRIYNRELQSTQQIRFV